MRRPFGETVGNDPGKPESLSNGWFRAHAYVMRDLLDRLWPRECFLCGERGGHLALCAACLAELPLLTADLCPRCALPTPVAGLACGACQRRAPHFDESLAVWPYAHPVSDMLLAFKHGQGFALTGVFVEQLLLRAAGCAADCILPVPLHPLRMRERGFNHACELSRRLARRLGIEHLSSVLVRDDHTPQLAGLRAAERRRALRGAFRCREALAGQHVLVVDDVMTSGATLDEIATTLKQRGARRVTNLVLARTLRQRGAP